MTTQTTFTNPTGSGTRQTEPKIFFVRSGRVDSHNRKLDGLDVADATREGR